MTDIYARVEDDLLDISQVDIVVDYCNGPCFTPLAPQTVAGSETRNCFKAQPQTHQALDKSRDILAEIIDRCERSLESVLNCDPSNEDIKIWTQSVEVCKMASKASQLKILRIEEAVANDGSDQVVVVVEKALSKGNSAQLVIADDNSHK